MGKTTKSVGSGIHKNLVKLINESDHKILAIWAADCAERVLPYFEKEFPNDKRPFAAIKACRGWAGGELKMTDARQVAIASHAAARRAGNYLSACSAARSAGHAAGTAHTPKHAIYAAKYAIAAIRRSIHTRNIDDIVKTEIAWQYQHLIKLNNLSKKQGARPQIPIPQPGKNIFFLIILYSLSRI